ncbi:MAG: hypothetical protein AAFZ65_11105 [Planctomycetota bacterium]
MKDRQGSDSGPRVHFTGSPAAWIACFAFLAATQVAVALNGAFASALVPLTVLLLVAGGVWLLAVRSAASAPAPAWILAGAVGLRLIALAGDADLSDDPYRYAFEGALVVEGLDPYGPPPADGARGAERARWPTVAAGINHPEVRAAYPPLMQLSAAAVIAARGGPEPAPESLRALRLFYALCDLACLAPLALLAHLRGRSVARAWLAWGWCPVVCLAFGGTGHFDALAILACLGGLALWEQGRARSGAARVGLDLAGGVLLGAGVLVKFLPVVALSGGTSFASWTRRAVTVALLTAGGLFVLPAWLGWSSPLSGGLHDYGLRWEASSILFRFVEPAFESGVFSAEGLLPVAGEADGTLTDPRRLARLTMGALFALLLASNLTRRADATRATAAALLGFVLLSPTLHPWYLTWPLATAAVVPLRAPLWLAATAPALYWPLGAWATRGEWREASWLWPAVLLPGILLGLWDLWALRRTADDR